MAKGTGGSGKDFNVSSDGTITVSRPDGSSSTVKPGDKNYDSTKDAMDADTGKGDYSGKDKNNNPNPTAPPDYWRPSLADEDKTSGTGIIKDSNGNIIASHDTYIKDGAMYDKTTGQILSGNHGTSNSIYDDPEGYVKYYDPETKTGYWVKKGEKPKKPGGGGGGGGIPSRPSFIKFNEPIPTFNSELKKVNKFTYFSGLDILQAKRIEVNPEVCFISKTIHIGELKDKEYIELYAKYYADQNASVEFYIIDGEREIPILSCIDTIVQNEKIFFGMESRFPINKEKAVSVRQGTKATNLSFEEAVQKSTDSKIENAYNVSYTPKASHKYKPLNSSIKIKVIIRAYAITVNAPYIKTMKIRKYGGNALWNQDL